MADYALNLNTLTDDAFFALNELDKTFIGTSNYMGIAYFWSYEYRYYLRDASLHKRKKVHSEFVRMNLPIADYSEDHFNIVTRFCNS